MAAAERRFWRRHPGTQLDTLVAPAETVPAINGLALSHVVPLIGGDLLDAVVPASRGELQRLEWFLHEFFHLMLGMTAIGTLLKRSLHGLYLLLYALDGDRVLQLPSWRISGDAHLGGLPRRLARFAVTVDAEAGAVDEGICTTVTLLNFRLFLLAERISPAEFEKRVAAIYQRQSVMNPAAMTVCEAIVETAWFRCATPDEFWALYLLLLELGRYSLNPPADRVRSWWDAQRIAAPDGPRARLTGALRALAVHEATTVDGAREVLAALGIVQPMGADLDAELAAVAATIGCELNPFLQVAMALGIGEDELRYQHPIGRATAFLEHGHVVTSRAGEERAIQGRADSLAPLSGWTMILPLLTAEDSENSTYRCEFVVHFPVGRLVSQVISNRSGLAGVWEQLWRGEEPALNFGRLTVMPAPADVRLLWDLERVLQAALFEQVLPCLCGTTCRGRGCACSDLAARIHAHVRADTGAYWPAASCIAGA